MGSLRVILHSYSHLTPMEHDFDPSYPIVYLTYLDQEEINFPSQQDEKPPLAKEANTTWVLIKGDHKVVLVSAFLAPRFKRKLCHFAWSILIFL